MVPSRKKSEEDRRARPHPTAQQEATPMIIKKFGLYRKPHPLKLFRGMIPFRSPFRVLQ